MNHPEPIQATPEAPPQISVAESQIEAHIQDAFNVALAAAEARSPNARRLWNDYLELRKKRSPERVAQLEAERLEKAKS